MTSAGPLDNHRARRDATRVSSFMSGTRSIDDNDHAGPSAKSAVLITAVMAAAPNTRTSGDASTVTAIGNDSDSDRASSAVVQNAMIRPAAAPPLARRSASIIS